VSRSSLNNRISLYKNHITEKQFYKIFSTYKQNFRENISYMYLNIID